MWGQPFIITGKEVSGGFDMYDVIYEFAECTLCGAAVSEEMQPTHERYHACQDLPPVD